MIERAIYLTLQLTLLIISTYLICKSFLTSHRIVLISKICTEEACILLFGFIKLNWYQCFGAYDYLESCSNIYFAEYIYFTAHFLNQQLAYAEPQASALGIHILVVV